MKKKQTHLQYALLSALASIILGLIFHFAGLSMETWAQYVYLLPFVAFIFINANAYSKANNHYVTYGNVFGSGFKLSLVVAVIMGVWGIISTLLFPDMKEMIVDKAEQDMIAKGVSDEQIEMSIEMTRKYFGLFAVLGLFVMYLFWGTIFSLIGAAIAKKKGELPPGADVQ